VSRLVNLTSLNIDALKVDSASYAQQFENAMNVNGGDLESATSFDYLMHFLTFGWKVREPQISRNVIDCVTIIFRICRAPFSCVSWYCNSTQVRHSLLA